MLKVSQNFCLKLLIVFSMLFLLSHSYAASMPANLTGIVLDGSADQVEVNFTFTRIPAYKIFTLSNPARIVIDLDKTTLTAHLPDLKRAKFPIKSLRKGSQSAQILRLVIEVKSPITTSDFIMFAKQKPGHRLMLSLTMRKDYKKQASVRQAMTKRAELIKLAQNVRIEKPEAEKPSIEKTETKAKPKYKTAALKPIVEAVKEIPEPLKEINDDEKGQYADIQLGKGSRKVVIVIDPGHGGKDPGASGVRGTQEKTVVLAISKKLQTLINQQAGMKAVLTRKGDYFISLRGRLKIARNEKADLFVAIHADAFKNPFSAGASVFALSGSGASSEAARWLAEKENYSEVGDVKLQGKNQDLRSVIIDLSQTAIISLSLQLGSNILKQLGEIAHLHYQSVEQARFMVLKSLDIPSVLVETGFLSNAKEEQRLCDPAYQQELAQAIMQGIKAYFKLYPPPGTLLAAQRYKSNSIQMTEDDTMGRSTKKRAV